MTPRHACLSTTSWKSNAWQWLRFHLPAAIFLTLPYEERLSACLLLVEEMEEALASEVAGVPSALLLEQSRRTLARLQGRLPL